MLLLLLRGCCLCVVDRIHVDSVGIVVVESVHVVAARRVAVEGSEGEVVGGLRRVAGFDVECAVCAGEFDTRLLAVWVVHLSDLQ